MIFQDVFSSRNVTGKYLTSVDDKVTGFANIEVNENEDVIFPTQNHGPPEFYAWIP